MAQFPQPAGGILVSDEAALGGQQSRRCPDDGTAYRNRHDREWQAGNRDVAMAETGGGKHRAHVFCRRSNDRQARVGQFATQKFDEVGVDFKGKQPGVGAETGEQRAGDTAGARAIFNRDLDALPISLPQQSLDQPTR